MMVHAARDPAQLSQHPLPAHHALEFCGVEDESALIEQRRSLSADAPLPAGVTVVSCGCSRASSGGSWSAYHPSTSLSKAVREWEAGRQRRAMVASNPRRSGVVSAYFWQELSSLSKKAAAQE
ncbi:hypothetical protein T484DRAFT_1748123 [Baffinella frigidus]|nr:hypothetical protein T484DRAFT_1748123 [Cryptophyta sp. CCMP2293]